MTILLVIFVSCAADTPTEESTENIQSEDLTLPEAPEESTVSIDIVSDGASDCTVIYPQNTSQVLKNAAFDFIAKIKKPTGVFLTISSDKIEDTTHEIVIGECNRPEVASIK